MTNRSRATKPPTSSVPSVRLTTFPMPGTTNPSPSGSTLNSPAAGFQQWKNTARRFNHSPPALGGLSLSSNLMTTVAELTNALTAVSLKGSTPFSPGRQGKVAGLNPASSHQFQHPLSAVNDNPNHKLICPRKTTTQFNKPWSSKMAPAAQKLSAQKPTPSVQPSIRAG